MILECKSCEKKFVVPDNAITKTGRLVQCSSCGNKWTQFPVKSKTIIEPKFTKSEIQKEKKIVSNIKKKKKITRRIGPSIYSKEYLEKKHGIKIDVNNKKTTKKKNEKKLIKSYFGFYSYLIIAIITVSFVFGILNLLKEIIIFNFPFTEVYIEYLFENLNNFKILFKDALNLY
tara:strand:- start:400 stop:921 length:522 start_codon:yes stop_codon:yes gene_type:complete